MSKESRRMVWYVIYGVMEQEGMGQVASVSVEGWCLSRSIKALYSAVLS